MFFWTAYIVTGISLFLNFAHASGGGDAHGHLSDLIAPLVNVTILFGFLAWKLKNPLKSHFSQKATEITNTLERASLKSKEAEVMLAAQQKKMSGVEAEAKELLRQAEVEAKIYETTFAREIEEKSFRLKTDATAKIEAERKFLVGQLNASLLDEVISRAKVTIRGNKDYQEKATSKILGEMVK